MNCSHLSGAFETFASSLTKRKRCSVLKRIKTDKLREKSYSPSSRVTEQKSSGKYFSNRKPNDFELRVTKKTARYRAHDAKY